MRYRLSDPTTERMQEILEMLRNPPNHYIIEVEEPDSSSEKISLVAIHDERKLCFFLAISYTDVEEASAVCAQAVLYCTTPNDGLLYYAVYDVLTQMVYICLCDPREETYEYVARHCMQCPASRVEAWFRWYISSNAQVLRQWRRSHRYLAVEWEEWALSTTILSLIQNKGPAAVHVT
jgi:hypothetical protein